MLSADKFFKVVNNFGLTCKCFQRTLTNDCDQLCFVGACPCATEVDGEPVFHEANAELAVGLFSHIEMFAPGNNSVVRCLFSVFASICVAKARAS